MTLTGARDFVDHNLPAEAIEEMGPMIKQVLDMLDAFTGVDMLQDALQMSGYPGFRFRPTRLKQLYHIETPSFAEVTRPQSFVEKVIKHFTFYKRSLGPFLRLVPEPLRA